MSIIIVGSSDVTLNQKLGHKIDQYDDIVRFNRAPVEGYEDNVGSKTTIRFINSHAVHNKKHQNEDLNFLPKLKNQKICSDYKITNEDFYKVFDKTCVYEQVNRFETYKKFKSIVLDKLNLNIGEIGPEPSVGINAICHFINEGHKPTVYGFHLHDENKRVSPHYWKKKMSVGNCHDFSFERKLIKKLIELNYLNLLS